MSQGATTAAFVALIGLTCLTFGLSHVKLGVLEAPAALGIGGIKIAIVAAVFVELARGPASHRLVLALAVTLVTALIAFAVADVLTRP